MATHFSCITDEQAALIRNASLFFVASADLANSPEGLGPVNLSPKGGVALHILDPNRVAFLDYQGSGNTRCGRCRTSSGSRSSPR